MELVRLRLNATHLVQGQIHQRIDGITKSIGALGAPLQPQLEDVIVAAALDHLVAGVVADVVQFVGHEQILGRHLIAAEQQALQAKRKPPHSSSGFFSPPTISRDAISLLSRQAHSAHCVFAKFTQTFN